MARTEKEEKEKFFADLYRLDSLDDEDEGPQPTEPAVIDLTKVVSPPKVHRKRQLHSDNHPHKPALKSAQTSPSTLGGVSSPIRVSDEARPAKLRRTVSERPSKSTAPWKGGKKKKGTEEIIPEEDRVFDGLVFFFVPNNDRAPVRRLRINKAIAYGVTWAHQWESSVTHVIVDTGLHIDQASREFANRKLPLGVPIVKDNWLTECIGYKDLRDVTGTRFRVPGMDSAVLVPPDDKTKVIAVLANAKQSTTDGSLFEVNKSANDVSGDSKSTDNAEELEGIVTQVKQAGEMRLEDYLTQDDFSFDQGDEADPLSSQVKDSVEELNDGCPRENRGFHCMEKNDGSNDNPNSRTMAILQQMATHYDQIGDQWRTIAYRKGIAALRKQSKLVRTEAEAVAIPGIGSRLAAKIEEIVVTDRLQRLDVTMNDPRDQLLRLFMGIYQVGYPLASQWIAQGHRSLEDLRQKVKLTGNQKVGIDHYHDFAQRIPRDEVAKHAEIVRKALVSVDSKLQLIVGGSYRRGNPDSGDIDLIITKDGATLETVRTLMMGSVIPALTKNGFLKAVLSSSSQGQKWHGASALQGSDIWRRIDLLFVPWDELGAALIYFTGNDIFNRSLRLLASQKHMRLNQHGLYTDVMRGTGRQRVTEGRLLEGQSERRIFEILAVPYRPPEHRKC